DVALDVVAHLLFGTGGGRALRREPLSHLLADTCVNAQHQRLFGGEIIVERTGRDVGLLGDGRHGTLQPIADDQSGRCCQDALTLVLYKIHKLNEPSFTCHRATVAVSPSPHKPSLTSGKTIAYSQSPVVRPALESGECSCPKTSPSSILPTCTSVIRTC